MKLRLAAALAAPILIAATTAPAQTGLKTAVFAGGCFWSAELAMESTPGVVEAVSGYSGGRSANPTYQNHRGHLEAVRVTYDPAKISYAQLTRTFFRNIDPTDPDGQFCDQGHSYRTAVFTADQGERQAAEQVKAEVARTLGRPVATEVRPRVKFWPAEAYHQDFAKKNPARYNAYKVGCGRERALKAVWAGRS